MSKKIAALMRELRSASPERRREIHAELQKLAATADIPAARAVKR